MKAFLIGIALLLTIGTAGSATAPVRTAPIKVSKPLTTREQIDDTINRMASKYDVSPRALSAVISCESSFNPNATNITSRESSYGLVQINRLAHPYVSIEQAKDIEFAVDFLAKNVAAGKGRMWTCFRS